MPDSRPVRGRLIFIAVWAIPLGLMVLAWLVYATGIGLPTDSANRGVLIRPPLQVGEWLPKVEQDDRWTLLIAGRHGCDSGCRHRLWFSRQVHIGLGREAWRLQRVYWSLDRSPLGELSEFLQSQHPGLQFTELAPEVATTAVVALGGDWYRQFFLVDPQGFLMMAYDTDVHGARDVLKDLRFLLKTGRG